MVPGVVKEGSPTITTLRYREAVEQVVGQDAAIGGLPGANVDLGDARRIVDGGLSDRQRSNGRSLARVPLEGCPDESALGLGVCVAVVSMPLGELTLKCRVATGEVRVGSESIAEGQLIAIPLRARRDEVQVMGAPSRMRLAEPVHLFGQVGRVEIVEVGKGFEASPGRLKVRNAGEDVDDRLSFETRNRRAADVVDAAADPLTDDLLQRHALLLETSRPAWVGRDEQDVFVCGGRGWH